MTKTSYFETLASVMLAIIQELRYSRALQTDGSEHNYRLVRLCLEKGLHSNDVHSIGVNHHYLQSSLLAIQYVVNTT